MERRKDCTADTARARRARREGFELGRDVWFAMVGGCGAALIGWFAGAASRLEVAERGGAVLGIVVVWALGRLAVLGLERLFDALDGVRG